MPTTVLMPVAMPAMIADSLAKTMTVVRLWDAPDKPACLAAAAGAVRAIASHGVVDAGLMAALPKLEIVASFGVGYDGVDTAYAAAHGITVTNTPDVLNEEVADTTLALILGAVRQLPAAERYLRAGRWSAGPFPLSASLRGRTVGILGLGRIGKAVARRCEAFGLAVAYHGRQAQDGVSYLYYPTLLGLAEACDILVVIAPGGEATRNLVDAAVLKALGPDGYLVNIARGSVVDEAALIDALTTGTIAGAGLDVFADEPRVPQGLIDLDQVMLLPHVGSASRHTRQAMGQLVVDNLLAWDAGRAPLTPVPETPWRARSTAG